MLPLFFVVNKIAPRHFRPFALVITVGIVGIVVFETIARTATMLNGGLGAPRAEAARRPANSWPINWQQFSIGKWEDFRRLVWPSTWLVVMAMLSAQHCFREWP